MRILAGLLLILSSACFAVDSDMVKTTTEPSTFFYWTSANHFPKLHLGTKMRTSDPRGHKAISNAHLRDWVVAAADPVSLRSSGGVDQSWILIELTVAPGFKYIDANSDFLQAQGCPGLSSKISSASPECLKALNETATLLSIDGIRFPSGEILFTHGSYFKPADVRIFNHESLDDPAERLRIQALFYKADLDRLKLSLTDSVVPSEISRLNPPFSGGGRGLLWEDLDGKPLNLSTLATPKQTTSMKQVEAQ